MSDNADFTRLTRNWLYWSDLAQLVDLSTSTSCPDCEVNFRSNDYAVHLRRDEDWWIVDTVNDRHQRQNDLARFSSYELAEKFLIWTWASTARSVVRAPILGPTLYAKGFADGVQARPVGEGIYELRSPAGRAVVAEPYATIFSHLMDQPEEEIERFVRAGIG